MLEDVEGEDAIKDAVAKWELMRIADDICVPKDFMLELDTIRIARGSRARADVQDEILPFPQDRFELWTERIAGVILDRDLDGPGEKDGNALLKSKQVAAARAAEFIAVCLERAVTSRAGEKRVKRGIEFVGGHKALHDAAGGA